MAAVRPLRPRPQRSQRRLNVVRHYQQIGDRHLVEVHHLPNTQSAEVHETSRAGTSRNFSPRSTISAICALKRLRNRPQFGLSA